jgi:asparagine synthase (glutamine-hydrolysing)
MCGIVGIANRSGQPIDEPLLIRMRDTLTHRGPDDEGLLIDGSVGLGHRRLSIIDLSEAGRQPIANEDHTMYIAYNGEVYNFLELRVDLEKLGHRFRSRTDAEVVLHAYEEWGVDSLDRLNGMFAFVVWDATKQELFLARDRYGIKPLYYYDDGDVFLVASEVKAFLEHPAFKVGVDPSALLEYFTFQNVFTDRTLFEGVRLLPAATYAVLRPHTGDKPAACCYWDFNFQEPDRPRDPRDYEEELHKLFSQAVKRQLISDVPISSYLSGGMDSGAITAVASQYIPYLRTFTCGFDLSSASGIELSYDERARAEALSYQFKTEHYEVVLKSGDMERVMPELIWHLEDPRIGQCYPNYYVARLTSRFAKVVLAGGGGDELFGGYPWRYYRTAHCKTFDDYVAEYYRYWQRLVPGRVAHKLYQPAVWADICELQTIDIFRSVAERAGTEPRSLEDFVNLSMYFEAKTFLHGLLLVEDKLSMAHGLETRVPFLDNEIVDFATQLPVQLKLRDLTSVSQVDENEPGRKAARYSQRTNDGKVILRRVLSRYMPSDYVNGVKQGFSAPDASWFRGDSIDYVRDLILNPQARIYEYLRRDTISPLLAEHFRGQTNRRLFIWSLLVFEWWLRVFMDGRAS